MATRRVDAALLTDSSALLCGILTDKDIATRVIAEGLKPEETPVSKVMTKNPSFVLSDTSAVEALQKMVQGRFRHLPVVENGEVIALLDITKCLYDAIARLEKVAEKGDAIAAAVQGVERQYGDGISAPSNLVDILREKLFRPSLGSIIPENSKVAIVSPSETVYTAARKMQELRVSAVIVTNNNRPRGILTPKDILMRVISQNLPADSTPVEKVMTPNPECGTVDTSIVDALHTMHDGKFLHLPVLDRDGCVVACLDVLHLTNAAVSTMGNTGGSSDVSSTVMQKFWDSALAVEPPETDDDSRSDISVPKSAAEFGPDFIKSQTIGLQNSFAFKLEDQKGRIHRFNCGTESLTELRSAVAQRVGEESNSKLSHIMYDDDEGDRVVLATDSDLAAAVSHARSMGRRVLKLHLEFPQATMKTPSPSPSPSPLSSDHDLLGSKDGSLDLDMVKSQQWGSSTTYTAVAAGAAVVVGISVLTFLKRGTP
ncbi:hypothetical protein GOP47_0027442 [Adiantum capillus-veneris]|nr:hypothetical protein GOP47_0027442 [Adiantum capillus-veneris]